jgi:hypothetical protein
LGTLDLNGVTAQNNIAQGSDGSSGVPGNNAQGGGIWSNGALNAENGSQILNNQAIGGKGAWFGGCSGCGASSNGGSVWGGGFYVAGGTANLSGIAVNNNSALAGVGGEINGSAYGGGTYVAAGTVHVTNDILDDNQAGVNSTGRFDGMLGGVTDAGGGLCVAGGTVNLSDDTLDGNMAGGATGLKFFESSYFALGGGLYVAAGTVTLCNDTVENNVAAAHQPGWGAGIGITGGTVYIDAATVANVIKNISYHVSNHTPYGGRTDNIDGPYTLT